MVLLQKDIPGKLLLVLMVKIEALEKMISKEEEKNEIKEIIFTTKVIFEVIVALL